MKRSIKKAFVLLLAMLLAIPAGIVATAEQASAATYTLVTHWDFEGDTKEEQLADKATQGMSKDTLNTSGVVDIANGVADVSRTVHEYLYAEGKEGSDLYSFENKTIVMKIKLEEYVNGDSYRDKFASFAAKLSVFEWGVETKANNYTTKPYAYYVKTNDKEANTVLMGGNSFTDGDLNDMGYRYYVMSFKNFVNGSGQEVMEVKQYVSTDSEPQKARHFICLADITLVNDGQSNFKTAQLKNENNLVFGKRPNKLGDNLGLGEHFDDIKIYDGVLDTEMLATEISNVVLTDGDGENDPKLIGAQVRNNRDSFDIRFVSEIDNLDYSKVGFKFNFEGWAEKDGATVDGSYQESGYFTETTQFAYVALNYTDGTGKNHQFFAGEDKYLVAIALTTELTADTDYLVGTVTPFAVDESGKEHYGTTYTVTVVDGVVKGFTAYN